jgi:hypothetical protein
MPISVVEFQVSSVAFLAAQLNTLQSKPICFPSPINFGGHQIVVDHLEFGQNSLRRQVPKTESVFFEHGFSGPGSQQVNSFQTQIAQDLKIHLANLDDILAHPNQPPALIVPLPTTMIINIDYGVDFSGDCYISFDYDSIEHGPLPTLPGVNPREVDQQLDKLARSVGIRQVFPLNLAQIIEGTNKAENAGVSVDVGLSRIAFRAELGLGSPTASPLIWQAFYNGRVDDHLQGSDWSMFIDSNVIKGLIASRIEDALRDQHSFQLESGPGSEYSNPASDRAHVAVKLSGNVDAGVCSVPTDITFNSDITVSAANTLDIDMIISWNTGTTACTVTAGALGAALGAITVLVIPISAGILNPASGFMSGISAATFAKNALGLPSTNVESCQALSDTHYHCTKSLGIKADTGFGRLAFNKLAASADGVTLLGEMKSPPLATPAVIMPKATSFSWTGPVVLCGESTGNEVQEFNQDPTRFVALSTIVTLENGGTTPLFLCSVQVENDGLNAFTNFEQQIISDNPQTSNNPIVVTFKFGYPGADYFLNDPPRGRYACQLLIATNGGVRLVSIPAPPAPTQATLDGFASQIAQQLASCAKLVDQWFSHFHVFNPIWSVDPPPGSEVEHSWEFNIVGLHRGERAVLVDTSRNTLVTAEAVSNASLRLNALVLPVLGGNEVSLVHAEAAAPDASARSRARVGAQRQGVGVIQRLLVQRAVIPLSRVAKNIGACYFAGNLSIFGVFKDGIELYDVTVRSQPRLAGDWHINGVRGALNRRGGLLAFGDEGLLMITTEGAQRTQRDCCQSRPIRALVPGQGVFYAIGEEYLEIYSAGLQHLRNVEPLSASSLARVGATLVAGDNSGLTLFDVGQPTKPRRERRSLSLEADDLGIPEATGARALLAVSNAGPSWLVDFPGYDDPRVVAHYPQPPWFYRAARLPGAVVRLQASGTAITISEFGASKSG